MMENESNRQMLYAVFVIGCIYIHNRKILFVALFFLGLMHIFPFKGIISRYINYFIVP